MDQYDGGWDVECAVWYVSVVSRLGLRVKLISFCAEHTLLVTKDGVEVLTARLPTSPGGPVPMPGTATTSEVSTKEDALVVGVSGEKEGVQVDKQGSGTVLVS